LVHGHRDLRHLDVLLDPVVPPPHTHRAAPFYVRARPATASSSTACTPLSWSCVSCVASTAASSDGRPMLGSARSHASTHPPIWYARCRAARTSVSPRCAIAATVIWNCSSRPVRSEERRVGKERRCGGRG